MDFDFSPEADEAATLAARIVGDRATNEQMKAIEKGGDRFDPTLWSALGDAGLLGLALPEAQGGAELGLIEQCRVIVEVGRRVAPVPIAAHVAASVLLAEAGTPEQQSRWLPDAATGASVLTVAVSEERDAAPRRPTVTAARSGDAWTLTGTKVIVASVTQAGALLVTATGPEGPAVFLVANEGLTITTQQFSDGDVVGQVDLADTPAELVGDGESAARLLDLITLTVCALQLGVTEGALTLTAGYAKTREQFGRPIGTFQAVSQRLADGYIDALGQSLTLWQAAWRLQERLPSEIELSIAKLFAADAGHRIAHTTVHVHGGVGIDLDGEAHRYFTAAKRWEFALGGSTDQALRIGRALAAAPA